METKIRDSSVSSAKKVDMPPPPPKAPNMSAISSEYAPMGRAIIGSTERRMTDDDAESPTVTAVSAAEDKNNTARNTISPTRFMPPKKYRRMR